MSKPERGVKIKDLREGAVVGSVGLEMGLSVIIGYLIGRQFDIWFETHPIFTVIWLFFGFGAAASALLRAYKRGKAIGREEEKPGEKSAD